MKLRITLLILVALILLALPGASLYYHASSGKACTRCHEIRESYDKWVMSTHRKVNCTACHGDPLTLDPGFHAGNLRRMVRHVTGAVPERILLKHTDLPDILDRCRKCHQQEFADWQAGPHGTTYAKIFLDPKHNTQRRLMDDCLRCHGMYFAGSVGDLVTPISTTGPWKLKVPALAGSPAIPCTACHQMHREGAPLVRPAVRTATPGPAQEIFRPSLALYDRRGQEHFSMRILPLPVMREDERLVKMSPDRRQALCYQCHAPLASAQVGSGDDRTAVGVHEGLSCLACHLKHGQQTRASCASCHPRLSNCGLDVEKMDTTFKDVKSPHNIHFVKCIDCHPKGVPEKPGRRRPGAVQVAAR